MGSHTYYLVEGTWTRDDFEEGTDAPTVEVGSAEFLELIAQDPSWPTRPRWASAW